MITTHSVDCSTDSDADVRLRGMWQVANPVVVLYIGADGGYRWSAMLPLLQHD